MSKVLLASGQRLGRLLLVRESDFRSKEGRLQWECICDCGNYCIIRVKHLREGSVRSCGCLNSDMTALRNMTHGKSHLREYNIWLGMKNRCYKPNTVGYDRYGGRGIKVCSSWLDSFQNFYQDMGPCPKGITLERINNDGNYESANCRWATRKDQANNRGKSTVCKNGHIRTKENTWIVRRNNTPSGVTQQCIICYKNNLKLIYERRRKHA